MSIIATPGASNANSFCTIAEGDAYHAGHVYATAWTAATSGDKEKALIMATRLLEAAPGAWAGGPVWKATQSLNWPRWGMVGRTGCAISHTKIPRELKWAAAEYARLLLGTDWTETNEIQKLGITSLKAGPVGLAFGKALTQKEIANPSTRALAYMIPDSVKILLVPSWLQKVADQEAAERRRIMFEVL